MIFNFEFFLTLITLLAGVIALIDKFFLKKKRFGQKTPWIAEQARSFFPVLLAVWLIRSFIVQPYRVPTGSLEPTVMPGDFIAVSQFAYGLRLPVLHTKIIPVENPKRGDIALFRWPVDPSIIFVKRVIGVPGDHVVYKYKTLYINDKKMKQKFIEYNYDIEPGRFKLPVEVKEEDLEGGVKHKIYIQTEGGENKDVDVVVPGGHYFMMGDNRDGSGDSRMWGFVPDNNLIGKGWVIFMSWDSEEPWYKAIQWHRIGKVLH